VDHPDRGGNDDGRRHGDRAGDAAFLVAGARADCAGELFTDTATTETYTIPAPDAADFAFTADGYTIPAGDAVDFNLADLGATTITGSVGVIFQTISFHDALQLTFLTIVALWYGEDHSLTTPGRRPHATGDYDAWTPEDS